MGEQDIRALPQSDLDLNLMLTDSLWGREDVPTELKDKLNKYFLTKDENGKDQVSKESLWGLLGFYTRDMRLGNLSNWDGELMRCRYMIDLANDLLSSDMTGAFLIALSRGATMLETSQSKGGFLRRINNTLIQKHTSQQMEPPKKKLFGGNKNNVEGGY